MPDGRIIVKFREYSEDYDREKEEAPVLRVELIYKWDGTTYVYAGRQLAFKSRWIGCRESIPQCPSRIGPRGTPSG
jgi:hypothetical protein